MRVSMNTYPRHAQEKALLLCYAIEAAGASEQLTRCTLLASEVLAMVKQMEETLHEIHDFDDGAWAAGKFRKDAHAAGVATMRTLATDTLALLAAHPQAGQKAER